MFRKRPTMKISPSWGTMNLKQSWRQRFQGAGALRQEEQQTDWEGTGDTPRRFFSVRHRSQASWGVLVGLLLLTMAGWYYQHRHRWLARTVTNQTRAVKTQMVMGLAASLVRDYRVAEGRYPDDLQAFLDHSMHKLKSSPPSKDFWGRPYLLETQPGGFVLRSAGPDGRYGTRDDLTCSASVQE